MDCESMPSPVKNLAIRRRLAANPENPDMAGAPSLAEYAYRARRTQLSCCSRGRAPADVVDDRLRRTLAREVLEHLRNH